MIQYVWHNIEKEGIPVSDGEYICKVGFSGSKTITSLKLKTEIVRKKEVRRWYRGSHIFYLPVYYWTELPEFTEKEAIKYTKEHDIENVGRME